MEWNDRMGIMQHQNGSSILTGTEKKGNQKGINTKGKGSHYFRFIFIDFTDTKSKSHSKHNQRTIHSQIA